MVVVMGLVGGVAIIAEEERGWVRGFDGVQF